MSVSEAVRSIWKVLTESNNFERVLRKVNLITAADGLCTAEMSVTEEECNMDGSLHGGFTSTLVDVISGISLTTHKHYPNRGVSVDLHITFLSAAPLGEQIIIEAKTNKVGRTLAFLEVDILHKSTRKPIAKGLHTKFIGIR